MFDQHKNFAYSTVLTAPSPATSGTSLIVQSGDGAKFPAVPFNATVWPAGAQPLTTNSEIVRVTARTTDTLTITRSQESTSARSIVNGDQIAATITLKTLTDIENRLANMQTVNVKDYGAVADGVTDDTAAFQNAVNDLVPQGTFGNRVYVPAGKYLIAGTITVNNGGGFVGEGQHRTVLTKTTGAQSYFIFETTGTYSLESMSFESLTLPTSGSTIKCTTGGGMINDIRINNGWNGIEVTGNAGGLFISQLHILNTENAAMYMDNCNDVYVDQFIFNCGNTTRCPNGVIQMENKNEAHMFTNGETIYGAYSMRLGRVTTNTFGVRPAWNTFVNVYFDSSASGVHINNSAVQKFTNCWFSNRPGNGVTVNTCDTVNFTSCQFTNNGSHGCSISVNTKRATFFACTAISNGSSNTSDGINVGAGTTDFIITGSQCTNLTGFSGLQRYGINVEAGASDRYVITENITVGNATGGTFDGGTGTNKSVDNDTTNLRIGNTGRLTANSSAIGTTLTDVTGMGFAIGANEKWQFRFAIRATSSSTAGARFAINGPSGATLAATETGSGGTATATGWNMLSTLNTAGTASILLSTAQGWATVEGVIVNGATAGTVQLRAVKTTSGTVTVNANSSFTADKLNV